MANQVLLKKSSVVGKVPTTTDLSYGEVALNYTDGKLYYKNSANQIKHFADSSQTPSLSINDLTDVDTVSTPPNVGQVLKWNGLNWVPAEDSTTGGSGTDADTLDGFDSSYFLNYNNLSNKPTLFSGSYNDLTNKPTFKTINGNSLLGTGDIVISGGSSFDQSLNTTDNVVFKRLEVKDATPGQLGGGRTRFGFDGSGQPHVTINGSYDSTSISPGRVDAWFIRTLSQLEIGNGQFVLGGSGGTANQIVVNNSDSQPRWTSFKTINGQSLIGDGDIIISGGSGFSGDYNDLTNKPNIPTVPTLVSAFTNDANYVNTTQLATKQNTLVSGNTIKTINGQSLLGSGNITISGGSGSNIIIEGTETLTNSNPAQIVDIYSKSVYRTVKYLLQAINNNEVHSTEVTLTHNDTNVFISEYGTLYTGGAPLITITADIDSAGVYLKVTPANANTVVDFTRISIIARVLGGTTPEYPQDLMVLDGNEDLMTSSGSEDLNV